MPHHSPQHRSCAPPAFTVVEGLVAIALIGVAGAALAASLTAGATLRGRATALTAMSSVAHRRVAMLAARSCAAPDTGGPTVEGGATGAWLAYRGTAGWIWSDSARAGTAAPIRLSGVVACMP